MLFPATHSQNGPCHEALCQSGYQFGASDILHTLSRNLRREKRGGYCNSTPLHYGRLGYRAKPREAEVAVAAISRSDAEPATKSDPKAEIAKLEASTKAEIAGLKAELKTIRHFFGLPIIILLLKIAFF